MTTGYVSTGGKQMALLEQNNGTSSTQTCNKPHTKLNLHPLNANFISRPMINTSNKQLRFYI